MTTYVLFLDDSDERHDVVERALSDANHLCLHAYTAEEAISLLKLKHIQFFAVCFDHDLGTGNGSGSDVASYVLNEMELERFPAVCMVHSHNSQGAENIASKLRTAEITTIVQPYGAEMIKRLIQLLEPQ